MPLIGVACFKGEKCMYLTYEETMRRIDEYERNDIFGRKLPREKSRPYYVDLYKGEEQIILVPLISAVNGLDTPMARYWTITDLQNAELIGGIIKEALAYIEVSPIDVRTRAEKEADSIIKRATNCKTYNAFQKRYMLYVIAYFENGTYAITPSFQHKQNRVYDEYKKSWSIPVDATDLDIGTAVIQSIVDAESFINALVKCPPSKPRTIIELLSSSKLSFEDLQDDHYVDEQDYGSAEIYQGYSYYKESFDDSVADLYYSIASELDCDISSDNIRKVYSALYGADAQIEIKEISHRVFEKRVEVIGKEIHHITYLKQVDESELLACELNLKIKPAGKRIYAKVLKDFEKMVESTRMEPIN